MQCASLFIFKLECSHGHAAQVFGKVDTQHFLLPHRRNRVYGIATLIGGRGGSDEQRLDFEDCLLSMRSNYNFPNRMMFMDLPQEPFVLKRHKQLVEMAQSTFSGRTNIFVDCSTSLSRPTSAEDACPCITEEHPVFSVQLGRYLETKDFMNLQGFFKSLMPAGSYNEMLNAPKFAQDLLGNSFSTTVFQAALMASFSVAEEAWSAIMPATPLAGSNGKMLRRVTGKRKAEEYDKPDSLIPADQTLPVQKSKRKYGKRTKKKKEKKGVDKRTTTSKGKKACATIWDKEQVSNP